MFTRHRSTRRTFRQSWNISRRCKARNSSNGLDRTMDCRQGLGGGRIGIELEAYYYSAKAHARLTAALLNAQFVDADLLVNWIRAVKSPAEIAYLRQGARLAEAAVHKAYDVIEPGVRECDAVAATQLAQYGGHPDFAGDITALPPTILAGENASAPHIMWSDRRFAKGE